MYIMDNNYRSVQSMQGHDFGILRKKEKEKEEELFVFGYSCKIYEDYDKSLYIDQGKHLIPWLGDESLRIDRYDCRGALNDLLPYLPKSEGFDRRANLSNEEKRIEQLCDQERYRALTSNEDEEVLYQEEELKRLQKALSSDKTYSEVSYSYDSENTTTEETSSKVPEEEEDSDPFIPPKQLDIPVGMKIPKSKKHNEIIEKTVVFISEQGAQMEILLKMKQADNPQFQFLSFDNDLHPYYRLMLNAVKSQKYKPAPATPPVKETTTEVTSDDAYLHPSLIQNNQSFSLPESAPEIPNINYKPSVDCTYSVLVNRIQQTQIANRELLKNEQKDIAQSATTSSNASGSSESLPLSSLSKSARRRRIRKKKKAAAASFNIYYTEEDIKFPDEDEDDCDDDNEEEKQDVSVDNMVSKNEEIYGSNNSSSAVSILKPIPAPVSVVEIPPPDVQLIIDKMASYVAKNGRTFEEVIRSKGDPRFSFVETNHVYNPYYNQKVALYLQLENPQLVHVASQSVNNDNNKNDVDVNSPLAKKNYVAKPAKSKKSVKTLPICFSIKKNKDQESLEIKSALPYEESEGDEGNATNDENNREKSADKENEVSTPLIAVDSASVVVEKSQNMQTKSESNSTPTKKTNDMTLEKWAQERLRAKLMNAAKEKLAAKQKNEHLQAERRKKAAEFINLLQKDNLVNPSSSNESNHVISKSSSSDRKKSLSEVITIMSDASNLDSDSIVSLSSEEDEKLKKLRQKSDNRDAYDRRKRQRDSSYDDRNEHRKSKHTSRLPSHNRSPSYSVYSSSKHKKHSDRERRSHSRRRHHYSNRSGSPSSSHKRSHKDRHRSKRSRYSNEGSDGGSDSGRSYNSHFDINKRIV